MLFVLTREVTGDVRVSLRLTGDGTRAVRGPVLRSVAPSSAASAKSKKRLRRVRLPYRSTAVHTHDTDRKFLRYSIIFFCARSDERDADARRDARDVCNNVSISAIAWRRPSTARPHRYLKPSTTCLMERPTSRTVLRSRFMQKDAPHPQ